MKTKQMKASTRSFAVLACALWSAAGAQAGVIQVVDFDYDESSGNGAPIVAEYGTTDLVTVDYRVYDASYRDLDRLQWYLGTDFGDLTGGVAMDDLSDEPLNWGSVTITVKDPLQHRVSLDSFMLANRNSFDTDSLDEQFKLGVMVYHDSLPPQEWDYRTPGTGLVVEGGHKLVTPQSKPTTSITIQWRYPHNIAIDDVRYGVTNVPEPSSLISWVLGLAGLGLFGYRRSRPTAI